MGSMKTGQRTQTEKNKMIVEGYLLYTKGCPRIIPEIEEMKLHNQAAQLHMQAKRLRNTLPETGTMRN